MHALEIGMLHLIEWIVLQLQQFPHCFEFVVCISKGGCMYVSIMLWVCRACVSCPLSSNVLISKAARDSGCVWLSPFPCFLVLVFLDITEEGIQAAALCNDHSSCGLWIFNAIITPLSAMSIPLPLLVAVHLPLSFLMAHTCHKPPWPTHRRSEIANFMGQVVKSSQATLHLIYFTVHTWNLEDL